MTIRGGGFRIGFKESIRTCGKKNLAFLVPFRHFYRCSVLHRIYSQHHFHSFGLLYFQTKLFCVWINWVLNNFGHYDLLFLKDSLFKNHRPILTYRI